MSNTELIAEARLFTDGEEPGSGDVVPARAFVSLVGRLADALEAAEKRTVEQPNRDALIRAIRVPIKWQGETPVGYLLDEEDAGMAADAILAAYREQP